MTMKDENENELDPDANAAGAAAFASAAAFDATATRFSFRFLLFHCFCNVFLLSIFKLVSTISGLATSVATALRRETRPRHDNVVVDT